MMAAFTNHLWQTTVFAILAWLLAAALRKNRADVRYRLWLAASLKFLVPFSLLMGLGGRLAWAPAANPIAAPAVPAVAIAADQLAHPFSVVFPSAPSPRSAPAWILPAVLGLWACGFVAVALVRVRAWRLIRAAVRASAPLLGQRFDAPVNVRSAPGLLEPGVVGWWRPVLLMPVGIETHLTPPQLHAVIVHELCHIRRRDNVTAALHMIVEAVFWFHPLVWWIGARLVDERERACDEAVLTQGLDPRDYAAGIVNVCKLYVESRLACVAGVTGADIKTRIEAIMSNRAGLRLNLPRKTALAVASAAAFTAPLIAGMITAPLYQDQPRFEVASIKPCENGPVAPGGRGGGGGPVFSPGRFVFNCGSLEQLIQAAYVANGEPLLNDESLRMGRQREVTAAFPQRIRGGPSWVRSERYTIEAKTDMSTGRAGRDAQPERKILMGPMLRALLEERFQLVIHRDIQNDVPMYALTVAKGGLKIKPVGPDGGCTPTDLSQPSPIGMQEEIQLVRRGGKPYCGHGIMGGPVDGSVYGTVLNGQTMDGIASTLSAQAGRHLLNRTGVEGKFIVYLEFVPDDVAAADPSGPSGPTVFTALEKLGLKVEPAKGPRGYIVIDRAERPSNR